MALEKEVEKETIRKRQRQRQRQRQRKQRPMQQVEFINIPFVANQTDLRCEECRHVTVVAFE